MKFLSDILIKAGLVVEGSTQLNSLAGVGTRMVVTSSSGVLSTQPLPTANITGSGTAGQVAYFDASNNIVSDNGLNYDSSNGRLSIGGTSNSYKLNVLGVPDGTIGQVILATTGRINIYPYHSAQYGVILESKNPNDVGGLPITVSGTTVNLLGTTVLNSLIGAGTRMVVTDANGTLSTQAIPVSSVLSVFGRTGVVTAQSGDYTTAQVTESGNLYYTDARSRAAISVTGSGTYDSLTGVITINGGVTSVNGLTGAVTLTTSNIAEGTNLYYTDARARAAISLTTTGSSGAATYTSGVLNIPNYTLSGLGGIGGTIATGQVAFGTAADTIGGSNNLFWDNANGRLGIGTNAPAVRTHIVYSDNTFLNGLYVQNTNTGTNAYSGIGLQDSAGNVLAGFQYVPSTFSAVQLRNSVLFASTGQSKLAFIANSGAIGGIAQDIYFSTLGSNSTYQLFIAGSTGNIGINTNSPTARLDVRGDTLLRGSGATLATTALTVQNSSSTDILRVINNGTVNIKSPTNTEDANVLLRIDRPNNGKIFSITDQSVLELGNFNFIHPSTGNDGVISRTASGLFIGQKDASSTTTGIFNVNIGRPNNISNIVTSTATQGGLVQIIGQFNPNTAVSSPFTALNIIPTINQTGGANGITRGLYVNPTLTAAADWRSIEWSNNAPPVGSNSWGLYGSGTAPNYMAGSLGIGTTATGNYNLRVTKNLTGAAIFFNVLSSGAIQSDVTTQAHYFRTGASSANATFTLPNLHHYTALQDAFGVSSTITNQYGFNADSSLTGATNNYGFYGNIASGTGRWNLYMNGTANNYMAGSLGIGGTDLSGFSLRIQKTFTGATTMYGIWVGGNISSDVTGTVYMQRTRPSITTGTFTLGNLTHFDASQATIGAGVTVTNQYGFVVESDLISATNNFGFYGNIASGTGRWNLYMNGTANNYLNGSLLIGSATDDLINKVQVTGTIVAGSSTSTNGSVILRGRYTSGYLTTLGTDGSSGGPMLSYGVESAQTSTPEAFVSSSGIGAPTGIARSAYIQNGNHRWYTAAASTTPVGTAISMTKHMELYNSGNLVLGGGIETAGHRLQVQGSVLVGSTSLTHGSFGAVNARVADGGIAYSASNGNGFFYVTISGDQTIMQSSLINFNAALRMSSGKGLYLSNSGILTPNSRVALLISENNDVTGTRTPHVTIGETLQNSFASTTILGFTSQWRSAFTINASVALNGQSAALGMMGTIFNQQIIAPASNSFLAGVVISPTFNDNTFTGNTKVALGINNSVGYSIYQNSSTALNYLNGTTLIGTAVDDGVNKLQVAGSIASAGIMRSDAARTAAINDVSIALLGSNITTYAAGFSMSAGGYGLNAIYAQHEQRFGGNATFDGGNLTGGGLILNRLAPTAAGTVTMTQQTNRIRTMSNLHLQTQFQGNNNLTVTHMSGLHIYGHYRTSGTGTLTVGEYYGVFLADPNEFGAGATVTGNNYGFYQQGAAPFNHFGGSVLIGTTATDGTSKLRISGLPTSAAGLLAGEVWNNGGVLTIV